MTLDGSGPTSRVYFSQRLRLHYVDWGNSGAPPLLLVHGGRGFSRNGAPVATPPRRPSPFFAPGFPRHGLPPRPPHGSSFSPRYVLLLPPLFAHPGPASRP